VEPESLWNESSLYDLHDKPSRTSHTHSYSSNNLGSNREEFSIPYCYIPRFARVDLELLGATETKFSTLNKSGLSQRETLISILERSLFVITYWTIDDTISLHNITPLTQPRSRIDHWRNTGRETPRWWITAFPILDFDFLCKSRSTVFRDLVEGQDGACLREVERGRLALGQLVQLHRVFIWKH